MRPTSALLLTALLALATPVGRASAHDDAPAQGERVAVRSTASTSVVPAGPGQRMLVLRFDGDFVYARACDDAQCDAKLGSALRPPESMRAFVPSAAVTVLELTGGKRVALVRLQASAGKSYAIVLAVTDTKAENPSVLFSGFIGVDGEVSTQLAVDETKGKASLKLTSRGSLCGQEVLTAVRTLDPQRLVLQGEATPDPLGAARGSASALAAKAVTAGPRRHRILTVRASSSGKGSLAVDGDPKTSWLLEPRGGRGFVSLASPADVPISGFDLVLSPPSEPARAPKSVTLVTDAGLFSVALPEDAVLKGGSSFTITLPKPIRTKCVALVVDEAYPSRALEGGANKGPKQAPRPAQPSPTFVSEFSALTTLDGEDIEDLARGLHGEGANAKLRESILLAEGARGVRAAIVVYPGLDGPGRDRARRVIDAGACDDKLLLYVPMLIDKERGESDRARDRIRACRKEAGPALIAAIDAASLDEVRGVYAEEAALVAPELSVPKIVARLAAAKTSEERRPYRRAIAKGALRAAGLRAVGQQLSPDSFDALPLEARIDLLRALGATLGSAPNATEAFVRVAKDARAFREQYLLLGPASELARQGDAGALAHLEAALGKAEDHRLRARAAELGGGIEALRPLLIAAIADEKVRVREAALVSLTAGGKAIDGTLSGKLAERLEQDPWTFVRRAAAAALGSAPADPAVDARMGSAVGLEEQPAVRAELVKSLGARGARSQRKVIAERAWDGREALSVRLRAIEALAAICDQESLAPLVEMAEKGRAPLFEQDRKLSAAAIAALVRMRPPDLKARLAPLLAKGAAPDMKELTERALSDTSAKACK